MSRKRIKPLIEPLKIKPLKIKPLRIPPLDKIIWGDIRKEQKTVSQSVKTKVYKRAGGKCEWSRCRKRLKRSEGEFHHWRDPPTERTTAFLCHMHHREKKYKAHVYKVETDIYGNRRPILVRRKRIPIKTVSKPKRTTRKKKATKTTRKKRH